MKRFISIIMSILTLLVALPALAASTSGTMVVTATNAASGNQLKVYDASGALLQTIATQGLGGVGGNAGGVAANESLVAVVNFGSQTVSVFTRSGTGLTFAEQFPTASKPVSVTFANNHLYVLGATTVESHTVSGSTVNPVADGTAALVHADGSAAQVGALATELIITEKSNVVETVPLVGGAVGTSATALSIPAGSAAPFGLITRGANAYVTIAHSDKVAVFAHDMMTDIVSSGTEHAPCWLALSGDYLYSSNSPSKSISMYKVAGQSISMAVPVAASLSGAPTDIAANEGVVAVIDGSNLSVFSIGAQGSLSLLSSTNTGGAMNGVAVLQ